MNDDLVRDGVREDHVLFGRRDERRDWPGDASVRSRVLKNRQSQTKRALGVLSSDVLIGLIFGLSTRP